MSSKLFIAGDWGTSNLRLFLCEYRDSGSSILETLKGPGVSKVHTDPNSDFEEVFFNLISAWIDEYGNLPVIISGMAGSTIGWQEAPYVQCPAYPQDIAKGRLRFQSRGLDISIISGLKVKNPIGSPDVMRGEELQLLGWMNLDNRSGETSPRAELAVLPGTHNKWVLLKEGRIETFVTALTGEMFALLKNHSVLIADRDTDYFDQDSFFKGVEAVERLGEAGLLHALFSTRSEQVAGDLSAEQGQPYLSGMLVTADIIGALKLFRKMEPGIDSVTLIGEESLCDRYKLVLDRFAMGFKTTDASKVAIAGYESVYRHLDI